jgi:hypothetical protein
MGPFRYVGLLLLAVGAAVPGVHSSAQGDPLIGTVAREVRDARRDGKSEIFIMVTGDEGFADEPSADEFLRGTTIFIGRVTGLPEVAVTNETIYTWQSARVGEVLPVGRMPPAQWCPSIPRPSAQAGTDAAAFQIGHMGGTAVVDGIKVAMGPTPTAVFTPGETYLLVGTPCGPRTFIHSPRSWGGFHVSAAGRLTWMGTGRPAPYVEKLRSLGDIASVRAYVRALMARPPRDAAPR